MTLACLLVAAQAGAPDTWHMNQTQFSIPIRINPERRAEIRELLLFSSRNQGQNWERVASSLPDQTAFKVSAQGDGLYWFTVCIVDNQGQQEPADPRTAPVGQKIIIDTKRPEVQLLAVERQGDQVAVRFSARDEFLDVSKLKLEYRTADNPSSFWTPVAIVPGNDGTGTAQFRPGTGTGLVIKMTARDLAGNEGVAQQELAAINTTLVSGSPPGPTPPPVPAPGANPNPTPTPLVGGPGFPQPTPVQPLEGFPPATGPGHHLPGLAGGGPGMQTPLPGSSYGQPLAASSGIAQVSTVGSMAQNTRALTQLVEITNKRSVKVDFEVAKFGPSGLGTVDVYLTTDDGRTWDKSQIDPKAIQMPNPGEVRGVNGPLQGSVTVPLPREGIVYGISLVVKSRAGLSKAPPQPGDAPQMRVELDTTPPDAELYAPMADPNKRDALMMRWKATDKNLADNPITLEWAPQRNGPWYFIGAAELPNTSQYSWQVPPDVPPTVFLRLTVRDSAGNTGVAQTAEPVLVDLSVPEATIIQRRPGGPSHNH
jgi:hypothetical protein